MAILKRRHPVVWRGGTLELPPHLESLRGHVVFSHRLRVTLEVKRGKFVSVGPELKLERSAAPLAAHSPRCRRHGRTAAGAGRPECRGCRSGRRCSRPAATGGCSPRSGRGTPSGLGSATHSSSRPPPPGRARGRRPDLEGRIKSHD